MARDRKRAPLRPDAARDPDALPSLLLLVAPSPLGEEALADLDAALTHSGTVVTRCVLAGQEITVSDVTNQLGSGGLPFGGLRLIVIRQAQALDAEVQTALARLGAHLPTGTCVVLWVTEARAPKFRKPLADLLDTRGQPLAVDVPVTKNLPEWVQRRADRAGIALSPEATERLLARVGDDLLLLDSEVQKLALVVGEARVVTQDLIDAVVAAAAHESIFRLIDSIAEGRRAEALARLHDLRERGEESPHGIIALLARHFRFLWQAHALSAAGWAGATDTYPSRAVAMLPQRPGVNLPELLKRQRWLAARLRTQARRFSPTVLSRVFARLLAADLALVRQKNILGHISPDANLAAAQGLSGFYLKRIEP